MALSNLSLALRLRFEYLGYLDDLQEAIEFGERAVQRTGVADPREREARTIALLNLSQCYRRRFEHAGNADDLHSAEKFTELASGASVGSTGQSPQPQPTPKGWRRGADSSMVVWLARIGEFQITLKAQRRTVASDGVTSARRPRGRARSGRRVRRGTRSART
jgi:hypothetical protein